MNNRNHSKPWRKLQDYWGLTMENKCWECKEWEKCSYWTSTTAKHFFKALLGDYKHHLSIPAKFLSNFKEELHETVVLRGPSRNTWRVGLKRANDTWNFEDGWSIFIRDHCLQQNDFLFFRYVGDSTFDVLMFDLTFCEKESSYFVNSHWNTTRANCECKRKEIDIVESERSQAHEINSSKKAKMMHKNRSPPQNRWPESIQYEGNIIREPRSGDDSVHSKFTIQFGTDCNVEGDAVSNDNSRSSILTQKTRSGDAYVHSKRKAKLGRSPPDFANANRGIPGTMVLARPLTEGSGSLIKALPSYVDETRKYPYYFLSSRRPVTLAEKERALVAATAVQFSDPGFIQVMKQCHVYKGFIMYFPTKWTREHLPCNYKKVDVILGVSSSAQEWICRLNFRENTAKLCKGWNAFVMDNNLEEGDVCLFKLCRERQRNEYTIFMDVSIFRVVDQVVPLTKFVPRADSTDVMDRLLLSF